MSSKFSFPLPTLQDLPTSLAHLCLEVEKFVTNEINIDLQGKKILVGFSGGIDSTALLFVLFCLQKRLGFTLLAAHFNHSIRPEADSDALFCKNICTYIGIPFFTDKKDVPALCKKHKTGLEETARNARYAFFADLQGQQKYDWLALGHQLNDLSEDVLMRLLRGAGWPALGGMPAVHKTKKIFRPLLLCTKDRITSFLHNLQIPFVEDATNQEPHCLRNRIRLTILPLLVQENPNFLQQSASLWQMAQIDKDSLLELLPTPIVGPGNVFLAKTDFIDLPRSLRLRAYKKCLETLGMGQALFANLIKLDTAAMNTKTNTVVQFPKKVRAVITQKGILFSQE